MLFQPAPGLLKEDDGSGAQVVELGLVLDRGEHSRQSGFGPAPFLLFQVVLSLEKGDGVFGTELSDPLAFSSLLVPEVVAVPQAGSGQAHEGRHRDHQQQGSRRFSPCPLQPPPHDGGPSRPDWLTRQVAVKVLGQCLGGGVAFVRLFREAFQADRHQVARNPGLQAGRGDRLLLGDLSDGLHHRGAFERRPSGQHLVEDRAQGVDVGGRTDLVNSPPRLLGGHVTGRAQDRAGVSQLAALLNPFGQAEVRDLGDVVRREEDVGGLQVAVDDIGPVGRLHRFCQCRHQLRRLARRLRIPRQTFLQAPAFEQFQ